MSATSTANSSDPMPSTLAQSKFIEAARKIPLGGAEETPATKRFEFGILCAGISALTYAATQFLKKLARDIETQEIREGVGQVKQMELMGQTLRDMKIHEGEFLSQQYMNQASGSFTKLGASLLGLGTTLVSSRNAAKESADMDPMKKTIRDVTGDVGKSPADIKKLTDEHAKWPNKKINPATGRVFDKIEDQQKYYEQIQQKAQITQQQIYQVYMPIALNAADGAVNASIVPLQSDLKNCEAGEAVAQTIQQMSSKILDARNAIIQNAEAEARTAEEADANSRAANRAS